MNGPSLPATDVRNELIAETEYWASRLIAAEVAWYGRQLRALQSNDPGDIIRAEIAREAAIDFAACLCWNGVILGQAGLSGIAEEIAGRARDGILEGRSKVFASEARSGRLAPVIPCASESPEPDGTIPGWAEPRPN